MTKSVVSAIFVILGDRFIDSIRCYVQYLLNIVNIVFWRIILVDRRNNYYI